MAEKSGLSAEALELRRAWIGASEVPALFGLGSLWELFRAKRPDLLPEVEPVEGGEDPDEEPESLSGEAEALERGNVLEDPIAQWAARRERATAYKVTHAIRADGIPVGATPDYVIAPPAGSRPKLLEIKTSINATAGGGWGDEGTDAVPFKVLLQVVTQLGCARSAPQALETKVERFVTSDLDLDAAIVVRLDGRLHLSRYVVPYSHDLFTEIAKRAEKFWAEHVIAGVAPPPGASEKAREWLRAAFPEAAKTYVNGGAEEEKIVARWREVKAEIAPRVKEKKALENAMRERIAGEGGLLVRGLLGAVVFGNDKPRSSWRTAAEIVAKRALLRLELEGAAEGWDVAEVLQEAEEESRGEFGPRILRWSSKLNK